MGDLCAERGLGGVREAREHGGHERAGGDRHDPHVLVCKICLLYTSDAADERSSVDLGGRRIIKKKNNSTE